MPRFRAAAVEPDTRSAYSHRMRRPLLLALLTIAGSCVPATPRPSNTHVALPPSRLPPVVSLPPPAADWRDWPVTPGTWAYRRDERGAVAMFGQPGADASAVLRCDLPNRRMFLSRTGAATGGFTVRTSSVTRQLATGATGGTPAYVAATLAANDPLLDAMAFSRGRFTLEQPGQPPLVLPAWAEVGRVVEDCR